MKLAWKQQEFAFSERKRFPKALRKRFLLSLVKRCDRDYFLYTRRKIQRALDLLKSEIAMRNTHLPRSALSPTFRFKHSFLFLLNSGRYRFKCMCNGINTIFVQGKVCSILLSLARKTAECDPKEALFSRSQSQYLHSYLRLEHLAKSYSLNSKKNQTRSAICAKTHRKLPKKNQKINTRHPIVRDVL